MATGLVSSSGDGGYHEVVNGALRAQSEGARPICAVLAAGNANDHGRVMQRGHLHVSIAKGAVSSIDVIRITMRPRSGKPLVRYAHSYIGLGLTSVVAAKLDEHKASPIKEAWLVIKTFIGYRSFKIRRGAKTLRLDSLLLTNINAMAKVLTLSEHNKPTDGLFEVVMTPHQSKLRFLHTILRAATSGLKTTRRARTFSLTVLKSMPMQIDGEVYRLAKNTKLHITCQHKALRTII